MRTHAAAFLVLSVASCRTARSIDMATAAPDALRAAVARVVPLMQTSGERWIKARECTSCHHQGLGVAAVVMARRAGIKIDARLLDRQLARMMQRGDDVDALLAGTGFANGQFGTGYHIFAAAAAGLRTFPHRDVVLHYLAGKQAADGRWPSDSHRPPLEDSPVTATALNLRSLSTYGFAGRPDLATRVARGRQWLAAVNPVTVEEHVFQILGLAWAGDDASTLAGRRQSLLALQRPDGGWGQIATRGSDAYATGQALVALVVTGVPVTSDELRRGVGFLLSSQQADGSWRVVSRRRVGGLQYFETGFPHGRHQYISFAGTAWAVMALLVALDPSATAVLTGAVTADPLPPPASLLEAALRGSDTELDRFLAVAPPGDPALGKALFAALQDLARVKRLVERGAPVETKLGAATPLWTAAGYSGAAPVVDFLLARGADPQVKADGMPALLAASGPGGDPAALRALLAAGADASLGDEEGSPLGYAVDVESEEKVNVLLDAGADLDARVLHSAVVAGRSRMLELLLARGGSPEATDKRERTLLHMAALVDWGDTRAVELLLANGANPRRRDSLGLTPLDYASLAGNAGIEAILERVSRERPD